MSAQSITQLGPYQILGELGRGGMAVVYRGYHPALNRTVAIKVLPPQLAMDASFVQRFMQEARNAARLDHPNIVTIHDVGQADGTYYIVMQEAPGQSLTSLIQREGRLPLERVITILAQIASALDYAHAQGLVHRDIKPGNIIVGPGDKAMLTDFGIAKAAEGTRLTQTGAIIGTPEYMSPEQAKGEPVGPATDIYSLGIVLYEMLAGRTPFGADNTPAVLYKQVHEQPIPLRRAAPDLPAGVDAVLARALAKSPEPALSHGHRDGASPARFGCRQDRAKTERQAGTHAAACRVGRRRHRHSGWLGLIGSRQLAHSRSHCSRRVPAGCCSATYHRPTIACRDANAGLRCHAWG